MDGLKRIIPPERLKISRLVFIPPICCHSIPYLKQSENCHCSGEVIHHGKHEAFVPLSQFVISLCHSWVSSYKCCITFPSAHCQLPGTHRKEWADCSGMIPQSQSPLFILRVSMSNANWICIYFTAIWAKKKYKVAQLFIFKMCIQAIMGMIESGIICLAGSSSSIRRTVTANNILAVCRDESWLPHLPTQYPL